MEFKFSITRLLLLIIFLVIFAVVGGFTPPTLSADSMLDPHRVAKAWRYCILLFISGAVSASLVDHFVGTLDRSNIRLLYIIIGAALMIGAYIWMSGLHGAAHSANMKANIKGCIAARNEPANAPLVEQARP
jgi:hypothetical protein